MRNFKLKLAAVALAVTSAGAYAQAYNPRALNDVQRMALEVESAGGQPIAIFDLDDTLINTRERNLRIIKDFVAQTDIWTRYPDQVKALANLGASDIRYLMTDTLGSKGITDSGFVTEINAFWLARFFTNEYCSEDQPNPGAVKYVRRLYMAGVKIIYLTGRDVPRMHDGTVDNLKKLGFPLDDDRAVLMMKPTPQGDDLSFKQSMFPSIAPMGTVVGVFENEPANINAQHDAFPNAVAIFLDTIHSPNPVVVENGISWVANFLIHRRPAALMAEPLP